MKIQEIPYNRELEKITSQLTKGAFLTVKHDGVVNVMSIGWCLAGYMWNRPVFQILIRTSRYSYSLIEKSDNFTVSFPVNKNMDKELAVCGSKSGREHDKISVCGLELFPSQKVEAPVIAGCGLYYECKILTKQKLPVEKFDGDESHENSNDGHYHVMYYGEIISCYKIAD